MSVETESAPAVNVVSARHVHTRTWQAWLLIAAGAGTTGLTIATELRSWISTGGFSLGLYQLAVLGSAWLLLARGWNLSVTRGDTLALPQTRSRLRLLDLTAADAMQLTRITTTLAFLTFVFQVFALESPAFYSTLAPLIVVGFVLHELMPAQLRPPFLLALSLSGIYLILGFSDTLWLVSVGAGIVGVCHLPIPFRMRCGILVLATVALGLLRTGAAPVPWSSAVWPILGSLFMFRTIVYVYDLKHDKIGPGIAHRLGYFFMLPNITFPLFPVVDYGAYRRGYYNTERFQIYQRGVEWIIRGSVQLLLYRVVYQELTITAAQVATWDQLAQHMIATFLLYIRVSGQFHLIIGIMHLFGFHLPETHKGYYLASSFTDLWRRINIYWKDFMMKAVYYPAFFQLRRRGTRFATVGATLVVFFATWSLHSYQWFWLLGEFPVTWPDTIFWSILAAALVANSLRESRAGRERSLGTQSISLRGQVWRGVRIATTFAVMCILWSLWMSPSVGSWLALLSSTSGFSEDAVQRFMPLFILTGMIGYGVVGWILSRWRASNPVRSHVWTTAMTGLLLAVALVPTDMMPNRAGDLVTVVRSNELNTEDAALLTRGYYEDLMGVSRFNSQLREVYMQRPAENPWPAIWTTPAGREIGGFMKHELVPSVSITYLGGQFTTNQWAIRDREYAVVPAGGTRRIALVGSSIEMGWGVGDSDVFENVAENLINADRAGSGKPPVEIMNFSVAAYKLPQHALYIERVLESRPQVLIFTAHDPDAHMAVNHLIEREQAGVSIPHSGIRNFAEQLGLGKDPVDKVRLRLEAREDELETLIYNDIVRAARSRGVKPVWLFVPLADRLRSDRFAGMEARARAAGFTTASLANAYEGLDLTAIRVKEFDYHPNAQGHGALAEGLHRLVKSRPELLGLE